MMDALVDVETLIVGVEWGIDPIDPDNASWAKSVFKQDPMTFTKDRDIWFALLGERNSKRLDVCLV